MSTSTASNPFRAAWLYRRLPVGNVMLAAGKGLSPAFLKLLGAVDADEPISFGSLEGKFPALDADDLELWLAELCRMELIAPAVRGGTEPAVAATASATAPAGPPRLLLVHKAAATRRAWRDLLKSLPVELHEAGTLEEADVAFNRLKPAGVVLGPEGSDFNALNLIHVLKHPRAPFATQVFLVLDESIALARVKSAAARADDTVHAGDWASLADRVARGLGLPEQKALAIMPWETPQPATANAGQAPSAIEAEHPRIAALLSYRWNDKALDELFDQLIFDDRGDRVGFSGGAMEDLLLLYRIHRELRPLDDLGWKAGRELRYGAHAHRPHAAARVAARANALGRAGQPA